LGELSDAVLSTVVEKGPKCSVALFIEQHPGASDDLASLLRMNSVPATLICNNINSIFGVEINPDIMRRHRRAVTGSQIGDKCACQPLPAKGKG